MRKFINLFFTIITLVLVTNTLCIANGITMPEGWRLPANFETQDEWRNKDDNRYLLVKADFNGDTILDEARLLISDKPPMFALFAFVSQKDGTYITFLLDEKKDINYIRSLGVVKVLPGRYKTTCGKGIIECSEGETDEVIIRYDSIDYFKTESANMYFYWDSLSKTFKKAWIND